MAEWAYLQPWSHRFPLALPIQLRVSILQPRHPMALNPVAYIEKVAKSFLRYQLTAYPLSDPHLLAQMRDLLSLDHTPRLAPPPRFRTSASRAPSGPVPPCRT